MANSMTPPMNPHHKPQEDVVVTQSVRELLTDYHNRRALMVCKGGGGFEKLFDALAAEIEGRIEAERRDMREAADEPLDYIDLFRIIRRAGRKDAAKAKAVHDAYTAAIRLAPTEPLGGENPND